MLFSSATYLFAFLPLSLIAFYMLSRVSRDAAKLSLIVASLIFYGWASVRFLPLLAGSVVLNYAVGKAIIRAYADGKHSRSALLRNVGVAGNLALLIYFKYTNFFIENVNAISGAHVTLFDIILPLGISFFTFQRIAYLVDCGRGQIADGRFIDFVAVSVFFPQLISGPIILYEEASPQFENRYLASRAGRNLTIGLVIFAIGFFKKVVFADNAGYVCDPLFDIVRNGGTLDIASAWISVLAYTVQLYFDFSGYTDMAIGSARMFGIRLPLNFHSPLRASSIIEYWRRWHMTLNRFMVRYFLPILALPLTRMAVSLRLGTQLAFFTSVVLPVFVTFVVIGIWHGASWTYVLFGVLHAIYVSTNEIWRNARKRRRKKLGRAASQEPPSVASRVLAHVLTISCVLAANVMFRSDTIATAFASYKSMIGLGHGLSGTAPYRPELLLFVVAGWLVILCLPNTQQIMTNYRPAVNWSQWRMVARPYLSRFIVWRPNFIGLAAVGALLATSIAALIIESSREPAQFIYFQF